MDQTAGDDWDTDCNAGRTLKPVSVPEENQSSRKSHHFSLRGDLLYLHTDVKSSSVFSPVCCSFSAAAQNRFPKNLVSSEGFDDRGRKLKS